MKFKTFIAAVLMLLFVESKLFAVEIIAHRGASWIAPENTLSAVKAGWDEGADGVEFDLWLSKDGKIVVFHDADTRRFSQAPKKVSDLTWDELQKLDVGGWKNEKFKGEKIPTLESILGTIPKGKKGVIEVKCGPEIVPELKRVIGKSGRADSELVMISFNFDSMVALKKAFPKVACYYLYSYKKDEKTGTFPELQPLIDKTKKAGLDGLNLQYTWPITAAFARQVHDAGLKLLVWTVNDPEVAKKLRDARVDAITTDRPAFIREAIK